MVEVMGVYVGTIVDEAMIVVGVDTALTEDYTSTMAGLDCGAEQILMEEAGTNAASSTHAKCMDTACMMMCWRGKCARLPDAARPSKYPPGCWVMHLGIPMCVGFNWE